MVTAAPDNVRVRVGGDPDAQRAPLFERAEGRMDGQVGEATMRSASPSPTSSAGRRAWPQARRLRFLRLTAGGLLANPPLLMKPRRASYAVVVQ